MCTLEACSTIPTAEPCPLCFGDCKVYLGTKLLRHHCSLQPRMCCKVWAPTSSESNLDVAVSFSMALMEKCSAKPPTTNSPVVCPKCEPDLTATNAGKNKRRKRPAVMTYQHPLSLGDGAYGLTDARRCRSADCARPTRERDAQAQAWKAALERRDAPLRSVDVERT